MAAARGMLGRYPFGAVGAGDPLLVLAGLSPTTGAMSGRGLRITIGPLADLATARRLIVLNRRPGLPRGMTMAELAAEHAEAITTGLGAPVDIVGMSTGGSIAQQLAADHPERVRRLVLISTACRLGEHGRWLQRQIAARVRAGATRKAFAVLVGGLVPPGPGRIPAAAVASLLGPLLIRDPRGLDDMATTIEAEDEFDLARCRAPIHAPTLIVAGADDRFYSPELFHETARLIPDSRLCLVEGRGHVTVMSDRHAKAELTAFLKAGA